MTLDEAVAAVLNGEKRGEADDAIVAAGMEGARKLVDALNRSPLGEAAMRPDGSYNRTRFERVIDVLNVCAAAKIENVTFTAAMGD